MALIKKLIGSLKKFFSPGRSKKRKKNKHGIRPSRRPAKKKSKKKKKVLKNTRQILPKKKAVKTLAAKEIPQKAIAAKSSVKKGVYVGDITHYFSRIEVVVIQMTKGSIRVGDQIHIQGKRTDFIQKVKSLQVESVDVKEAKRGTLAGLKVIKEAKVGDKIFKL